MERRSIVEEHERVCEGGKEGVRVFDYSPLYIMIYLSSNYGHSVQVV